MSDTKNVGLKYKDKFTFIDLFAGCGGLSEGFLISGHFQALAHVEWEFPMVNTLRNRLVQKWKCSEQKAEESVVMFDIQNTDELLHGSWSDESIRKYGKFNNQKVIESGLDGIIKGKEVDLIIGGPPCQAYSIAGRAQDPNSMKDDYRNYLFESFAKVVENYKPKLFVFENVPGILSAKPGDRLVTERIFEAFKKIGYEIRSPKDLKKSIFSSADFQVPQDRHRVIIFGVRKDFDFSPEDFYLSLENEKSNFPYKTVRDAIGYLPKFRVLKNPYKENGANVSHELIGTKKIPQHVARYHNKRDIAVFKEWLSKGMNYFSQEEKLALYTKVSGKKSNHVKYRSLEWNKPSPTVVAHLYKDGLMFIHPDEEQLRSITIREAALLQTFPEDFIFLGSSVYCFKMIGNAVPVDFAKAIADSIYKTLGGEKCR